MNNYNNSLEWRYATKKFDTSKKIPDNDLEALKEAIRLSPSAYGLQPYEVLIVEEPTLREKLKPAAWNQSQITDASHLIVFANKTNFGEIHIDEYLQNVSETRGLELEDIKGYGDFMKSKIMPLSAEIKNNWTVKQAYIALGNLLSAAAHLKIDSCPMEGFDPVQFNEILGLNKKGLNAAVVVTVGYRSEEDQTQHYAKVRKSKNELFTTI